MKLFLFGIGHLRPEQIDVARQLKKHHDIAYWVRMHDVFPIDEKEFSDTIFHPYRDAIAGNPAAGVDVSGFDPPSLELLKALAPYESEYMTMVNKWYPAWNVDKRKDFYYDLIRYWSGVLDMYEPDALIFLEIPHEMFNFVAFALAKYRGIRTIMFENTILYDRLLRYEDYREGSPELMEAAKAGFPNKFTVEDLSPEIREEYLRTLKKDEPPTLTNAHYDWYRGPRFWYRQFKSLGRFVKDGTIWERGVARVVKIVKEKPRGEYARLTKPADMDLLYVYLGFHSQPERTTSPQADVYVDQILMAKTIAAALPEGWLLYVKEHPMQWVISRGDYSAYRYRGYYEEIAKIPNVRLVPIETNTFHLMRHARAVATATGTLGWEALLRGLPVLMFGYAWYRYAAGVSHIKSTDDCRKTLLRIKDGFHADPQAVLNFVGALDRACIHSSLDPFVKPGLPVDTPEGVNNLYKAITEALGSERGV